MPKSKTASPLQVVDISISHIEKTLLEQAQEQGCKIEQHQTPDGKTRLIVRGFTTAAGNIQPNPWNPNEMTDREQEATDESIDEYGLVVEIVGRVDPEQEFAEDKPIQLQIIDGEHRHRHFGQSEAVAINVLIGLSDAEAQKLTVIMDSTRGTLNKVSLANLLKGVQGSLGDSTGLGLPYQQEDLQELIRLADVDWDNFSDDFSPELESPDDETHASPEDIDREDEQGKWITACLPPNKIDALEQAELLLQVDKANTARPEYWGAVLAELIEFYLSHEQD